MAEQRLGVAQLVVSGLADGHLKGEALRCDRRQLRLRVMRLNCPRGQLWRSTLREVLAFSQFN